MIFTKVAPCGCTSPNQHVSRKAVYLFIQLKSPIYNKLCKSSHRFRRSRSSPLSGVHPRLILDPDVAMVRSRASKSALKYWQTAKCNLVWRLSKGPFSVATTHVATRSFVDSTVWMCSSKMVRSEAFALLSLIFYHRNPAVSLEFFLVVLGLGMLAFVSRSSSRWLSARH